jgi:DNA-directed RNA polymerase specialized sigma24 family protein
MITERSDAIQAIVTLARQHGISIQEIAAALGTTAAAPRRRSRRAIVQLLGYLGGTFVFAASVCSSPCSGTR